MQLNTGRIHVAFTLFSILLTQCLWASTEENTKNREQLNLSGLATFEQFGNDYFIAALYTEEHSANPETLLNSHSRKRMIIRITADEWPANKFVAYWNQALLVNLGINRVAQFAEPINEFTGMIRNDLRHGDEFIINQFPDGGTEIIFNDTRLMKSRSAAFFSVLLETWLGRKPPSETFKQNILSFRAEDSESNKLLLARFEGLSYSEQRRADIRAWRATGKHDFNAVSAANQTEDSEIDKIEQALAKYRSDIFKSIWNELQYPSRALKLKQQGKLLYKISIDREGRLLAMENINESPYQLLNNAAKRAIVNAEPLPGAPKALNGDRFEFILPFNFYL